MENTSELSENASKLIEYKEQGFLFHGSPNPDIPELSPREAKDVDSTRTFNNDIAVFATNNAHSSIIFSLLNDRTIFPEELRGGKWSVYWENDQTVIAGIPLKWKEYIENHTGYIYILPSITFTVRDGSQFKSKVAVTPINKIEATLNDYISLGGKVEWTEE